MADEFPRAEVIGIDLAPVQPRYVQPMSDGLPSQCPGAYHPTARRYSYLYLLSQSSPRFELFDINLGIIPYPDGYFDLIHARCVHIGVW